jgi:hypothetical protein
MLIFNCTEAASKFFSRVHKGKKITRVESPPSPVIEDDGPDESAEQWLVHAVTVQRKHVLFAIHIPTRYCMIFADAGAAIAARKNTLMKSPGFFRMLPLNGALYPRTSSRHAALMAI